MENDGNFHVFTKLPNVKSRVNYIMENKRVHFWTACGTCNDCWDVASAATFVLTETLRRLKHLFKKKFFTAYCKKKNREGANSWSIK